MSVKGPVETTPPDPLAKDRHVSVWTSVILAAVVVFSLGTTLVGARVLFGTDMLQGFAPWNDQAPPGFRPHNPYEGDKVNEIMPFRAEFRRRVLAGRYPLWTTLPSGGMPLGTLPHFGALSPLNLPSLVLPLWYAPVGTKFLEMAVAAAFTFLFLRRLGLKRPASLFGGLVFMNCGFLVGWTNWPQAQVGAVIPALFWAVERAVQARTIRSLVPVTVAVAVMILAGFPAVTLMALGAASLYLLVRIFAIQGIATRTRLIILAGVGAAILLGVGLTALQLLPFREQLATVDQGYRRQAPQSHVPLRALLTMAVPNAFGSPVDYNYFGDRHIRRVGYQVTNYWEIQSFIGLTAVLLVIVAATRLRRRSELVRGARAYLWAGVIVAALLIFVGGPLLGLLQHLVPFFRTNFIGRLRSVWGLFLAALAASGLESLSRARNQGRASNAWTALVWAVAVAGGLFLTRAAWSLAGEVGRRRYVALHAVIPLLAGGVTLVAILLNGRTRLFGRRPIVWIAPLMIGLESIAFAGPYLPKTAKAMFYPTTPAHVFLQQHLGHDRLAAARTAMMAGTTTYYGLRSVTSHAFQDPRWLELLEVANQHRVGRSVYPHLRALDRVASSPTLDRIAVRYFVTDPDHGVFGATIPAPAATSTVHLSPTVPLLQEVPASPIRGIGVGITGGLRSLPRGARLAADVLDPSGRNLATGTVRLDGGTPRTYVVPVPEINTRGSTLTVRISLRASGGHLAIAADRGKRPALSTVIGGQDRLRLVFVRGVLIYQRLDALPRIRWAGRSEVIQGKEERLFALSAPVDPGVVVLDRPGPAGSGKGASIRILEDGEDELRASVSAGGDGYLVVADSMQAGWKASLDGRPTPLFPAENAGAAVLVPAGRHEVTLKYNPASWRAGRLFSAISLVLLLGMFLPQLQRKRAEPSRLDGSSGGNEA